MNQDVIQRSNMPAATDCWSFSRWKRGPRYLAVHCGQWGAYSAPRRVPDLQNHLLIEDLMLPRQRCVWRNSALASSCEVRRAGRNQAETEIVSIQPQRHCDRALVDMLSIPVNPPCEMRRERGPGTSRSTAFLLGRSRLRTSRAGRHCCSCSRRSRHSVRAGTRRSTRALGHLTIGSAHGCSQFGRRVPIAREIS